MRLGGVLLATLACCNSLDDSPVHFLGPTDRAVLHGRAVDFRFDVQLEGLRTGPDLELCFTLQNKRLSFEAFTQCLNGSTFKLTGIDPGIWKAQAYLVPRGTQRHFRGGHFVVATRGNPAAQRELVAPDPRQESPLLPELGGRETVHFMVEEAAWREEARLTRHGSVDRSAEAVQRWRRLQVFDIVDAMVTSTTLKAQLDRWAVKQSVVVLMMNAGHVELCLNAIFSLRAVGVSNIMVFALDDTARQALQHVEVASYLVPNMSAYCTHCQELRDVWTRGFADIATLKPACVLAVLRLGYNVLWMDTDIVAFRNPFDYLLPTADLTFQVGGSFATDIPLDVEDALRADLCTGLYFALANERTEAFFEHTIQTLALFEDEVKFGDQSATNLVLFEQHWRRGIEDITFQVLDPVLFPTGGVYFVSKEPQARGVEPVLVHNNFLIGRDLKIQRFRDFGLWYVDHRAQSFWARLCTSAAATSGRPTRLLGQQVGLIDMHHAMGQAGSPFPSGSAVPPLSGRSAAARSDLGCRCHRRTY